MSHTTTLKTVVIRDVAALQRTVAELKAKGVNCDLVENQRPRMYYAKQHGESAYVLKLHDAPYDVGFDLQADGSYAPVFDEWADHVANQIGAGKGCGLAKPGTPEGRAQWAIGQFMQGYAKNAAINAATAQGFMVESTSYDKDGNLHLTIAA